MVDYSTRTGSFSTGDVKMVEMLYCIAGLWIRVQRRENEEISMEKCTF
jgi:hypothetical protein